MNRHVLYLGLAVMAPLLSLPDTGWAKAPGLSFGRPDNPAVKTIRRHPQKPITAVTFQSGETVFTMRQFIKHRKPVYTGRLGDPRPPVRKPLRRVVFFQATGITDSTGYAMQVPKPLAGWNAGRPVVRTYLKGYKSWPKVVPTYGAPLRPKTRR